MFEADDLHWMQQAHALAQRARTLAPPNPAVGCVLVRDGQLLGEGLTSAVGGPHAEINALNNARGKAGEPPQGSPDDAKPLVGATAFVTLEPCCHFGRTPPCTEALIAAGVRRVVVAATDPDPRVAGQGVERLRAAGVQVDTGLLPESTEWLNRGFFCRQRLGRPWVRVKLASSLDGRTAMASGESMWITGAEARRDVQFLRAESDCILTGSGTVLQDDPALNVRLEPADLGLAHAPRQPLRAIVDSQLRTPAAAKLFKNTGHGTGSVRIYCRELADVASAHQRYADLGVAVAVIPGLGNDAQGLDLPAVLTDLGQLPTNLVHVEAGATLCGALLQAGLVDEIVIYLAPHLMGNQGRAQFVLPEIVTMHDRIGLQLDEVRQFGDDIRLSLRPADSPFFHLVRVPD